MPWPGAVFYFSSESVFHHDRSNDLLFFQFAFASVHLIGVHPGDFGNVRCGNRVERPVYACVLCQRKHDLHPVCAHVLLVKNAYEDIGDHRERSAFVADERLGVLGSPSG